jgi:hypothetical protein
MGHQAACPVPTTMYLIGIWMLTTLVADTEEVAWSMWQPCNASCCCQLLAEHHDLSVSLNIIQDQVATPPGDLQSRIAYQASQHPLSLLQDHMDTASAQLRGADLT